MSRLSTFIASRCMCGRGGGHAVCVRGAARKVSTEECYAGRRKIVAVVKRWIEVVMETRHTR